MLSVRNAWAAHGAVRSTNETQGWQKLRIKNLRKGLHSFALLCTCTESPPMVYCKLKEVYRETPREHSRGVFFIWKKL